MKEIIQSNLATAFPEADIQLEGDGCQLTVILHSDQLAQQSRVAQHRAVFKAIGSEVGYEIHALSIQVHPQTA